MSAHLDATLADLEAVIRSRKNPPSDVSAATLGRRLVERGEVYDAVSRTYTPGPGFFTLFDALVTDARAEAKQPVQAANLPNSQENL
ncbi:hypothetical protein MAUB_57920 [Mycolicibacterium aubagnense]|uniref:Uncharacterized protein n=1 Tax=Mycolicibacterium aubagnense TaxID=319707 RepID=A0ABM7IM85_9MYCO|nr:hypothetical protein MAUB_57920 [Mycolicibacterium aubagnense]